MISNRIQKLLYSEFSEFNDVVLVESPFAETNRKGEGIKQVQIGLTPTKLLLAEYKMQPLQEEESLPERCGQDPDLDSFELVSAYPVDCVNLSVFRHRRRQTIKARFCNGRLGYYELGGWQERKMLWSLWCERIKFLSPYESGTSVSETSVATSSSGSSLYLVSSSLVVSQTGHPTLWCHFGSSSEPNPPAGSWADPHLYLGPSYFEKGVNYMSLPEITKSKRNHKIKKTTKKSATRVPLVLSEQHELLAREAVVLWESQRPLVRKLHRRYGLLPFPNLMAGLGLWRLTRPQAFSLQVRQNASTVHLPQTADDCQPAIPVAQLTRTVSLESLPVPALCPDTLFQLDQYQPPPEPLQFWTSEEQNNECHRKQYKNQQRYLRLLRKHPDKSKKKLRRRNRNRTKTTLQTQTFRPGSGSESLADCRGEGAPQEMAAAKSIYSVSWQSPSRNRKISCAAKRFTSSDLAHQLTMIDKQLFSQIDTLELGRLRQDMCSWRAPRLAALLLFSHRVSCLVVGQILSGGSVKERAVLIVRFIGVAYKCHRLHSLQSAGSVLAGLHSPAVYRLHLTWACVRRHFASKYRRFSDLSRRYQDPRLPLYLKTFDDLAKTPPYIPSTGLMSAVLLQRLPELPTVTSSKFSSEHSEECLPTPSDTSVPTPMRRFLSALNIRPPQPPRTDLGSSQSDTQLQALSRETLVDLLDQFFAPVAAAGRHPARRVLEDLQYFLETSQAAAARYAIPTNPRVRAFLLHSSYDHPHRLFTLSKQLEP